MKRIILYLSCILLAVSCGDTNRQYVRKAVRIMDKQGLFAEGPEWQAARKEALSAKPESLEQAQEIVRKAASVAGGKHSALKLSSAVKEDATSEWPAPASSSATIPSPPTS